MRNVFGTLPGKIAPKSKNLKMRIHQSLVAYHEAGEIDYFLSRGGVIKKGWSKWTGPPRLKPRRFQERGTYQVKNG